MAVVYKQGDSFLHSLDPRTKLIMFFALTFIALLFLDPLIIGSLFFGLYALAVNAVGRKTVAQSCKPLILIFALFSFYNLFWMRPAGATHLFYLLPWWEAFPITVEGLIRSVALFFRFFIVVLAVHTVLYTTPAADLVLGLTKREQSPNYRSMLVYIAIVTALLLSVINLSWRDKLYAVAADPVIAFAIAVVASIALAGGSYWLLSKGLPPEIGLTISLGFSTVGILIEQSRKITDAQKARGLEMEHENVFLRIKALASSLIPIFFATIERAENIAIAILTRAFDFNIRNRTYHRRLSFQKNDYMVLAILLFLLFGGLALNYLGLERITESVVLALFFR
ncbi:MAG: energy-coupling factor transporter transmembrane protein EcfT [Chloroflexi bacterium]|nr:energy-coupling factor transporter transmembrane protein EcfT [Chloroflexota bacterium]